MGKRFEISLIDFEKGYFKKFETDDEDLQFVVDLMKGTITRINRIEDGGTITITGDLSIIKNPRDELIKKALEDSYNRIAEINRIYANG